MGSAVESVCQDVIMSRRPGVPLSSDQSGIRVVGEWWDGAAWEGRFPDKTDIRLRVDFVVPFAPHVGWMSEEQRRTPMKDLVRRRGLAARLYLVVIAEQQNLHCGIPVFEAGPIVQRSKWRDRIDEHGALLSPSWATLTLGYFPPPVTKSRHASWAADAARSCHERVRKTRGPRTVRQHRGCHTSRRPPLAAATRRCVAPLSVAELERTSLLGP